MRLEVLVAVERALTNLRRVMPGVLNGRPPGLTLRRFFARTELENPTNYTTRA